eukprot:TRINITY_DN5994_c0_g1_i1.p1 TRINITY_DN5994_c0_g1~~TRINITY_DN5994_c0_g1_i1.p1  ORF type:complete len:1069 (+),score=266.30 TRINITY_DN5994_c0_g1_i1:11-3217(+)
MYALSLRATCRPRACTVKLRWKSTHFLPLTRLRLLPPTWRKERVSHMSPRNTKEGVEMWQKWTTGLNQSEGCTWWWDTLKQLLSFPEIPSILKNAEEEEQPVARKVWDLVKEIHAKLYDIHKAGEEPPGPPEVISVLVLHLYFALDKPEEAYSFLDTLSQTTVVTPKIYNALFDCEAAFKAAEDPTMPPVEFTAQHKKIIEEASLLPHVPSEDYYLLQMRLNSMKKDEAAFWTTYNTLKHSKLIHWQSIAWVVHNLAARGEASEVLWLWDNLYFYFTDSRLYFDLAKLWGDIPEFQLKLGEALNYFDSFNGDPYNSSSSSEPTRFGKESLSGSFAELLLQLHSKEKVRIPSRLIEKSLKMFLQRDSAEELSMVVNWAIKYSKHHVELISTYLYVIGISDPEIYNALVSFEAQQGNKERVVRLLEEISRFDEIKLTAETFEHVVHMFLEKNLFSSAVEIFLGMAEVEPTQKTCDLLSTACISRGKTLEFSLILPLIPAQYKQERLPQILLRHRELLPSNLFRNLLKTVGISPEEMDKIKNTLGEESETALQVQEREGELFVQTPEWRKERLALLTNIRQTRGTKQSMVLPWSGTTTPVPRPVPIYASSLSPAPYSSSEPSPWSAQEETPEEETNNSLTEAERVLPYLHMTVRDIEEKGRAEENEEQGEVIWSGILDAMNVKTQRMLEKEKRGDKELGVYGMKGVVGEREKREREKFYDGVYPEIEKIFSEMVTSQEAGSEEVLQVLSFVSHMEQPPLKTVQAWIDFIFRQDSARLQAAAVEELRARKRAEMENETKREEEKGKGKEERERELMTVEEVEEEVEVDVTLRVIDISVCAKYMEVLSMFGENAKALNFFMKYSQTFQIEKTPESMSVYHSLIRSYYMAGTFSEAERLLAYLREEGFTFTPLTYLLMFHVFRETKNPELIRAYDEFRELYTVTPETIDTFVCLSELLTDFGHNQKSLAMLEEIKKSGIVPRASLQPAIINIMEKNPLVGPEWGIWLFFGDQPMEHLVLEPCEAELDRRRGRRATVEETKIQEEMRAQGRGLVSGKAFLVPDDLDEEIDLEERF